MERRDSGYIRERMLNMELPGGRKRGRPQRRFMDVLKDMHRVGVTEVDAGIGDGGSDSLKDH